MIKSISFNFLILCMFFFIKYSYTASPLFISLGSFCAPAIQLRNCNLRKEAYPFDWIISSFDALYKCLDSDFNCFLQDLRPNNKNEEILDFYGFRFIHDWPTHANFDNSNTEDGAIPNRFSSEWRDFAPLVREKYLKRITRFRQACDGDKKVYFIRVYDTTKLESIMLRDLIIKKYKNLKFELIVISEDEQSWNLEKIQNFNIKKSDWDKINLWENIFKVLK